MLPPAFLAPERLLEGLSVLRLTTEIPKKQLVIQNATTGWPWRKAFRFSAFASNIGLQASSDL